MENEIIGVSPNIRKIRELIRQVADTGLNVVVSGETGVGKELIVNNLYKHSDRVSKPFIKVNCAALPDTLLESEMFGYERGAFTGAVHTKRGKFEQANTGLLFLDEIGDMSLPLQSKLLHVLQGDDYTPLGSERPIKTDVWIIAATNRNLELEMQRGNFRSDLFFRLNNVSIVVEPLRRRPEDIPVLIEHYSRRYAAEFTDRAPAKLSRSTMERLTAYPWPGNVRELQNVLKRLIVIGEREEAIEAMLMDTRGLRPETGAAGPEQRAPANVLLSASMGGAFDLENLSLKRIRKRAADHVEKALISQVLIRTGWNRSKASRILKVSYKTLLQKIEELEINPPPELA